MVVAKLTASACRKCSAKTNAGNETVDMPRTRHHTAPCIASCTAVPTYKLRDAHSAKVCLLQNTIIVTKNNKEKWMAWDVFLMFLSWPFRSNKRQQPTMEDLQGSSNALLPELINRQREGSLEFVCIDVESGSA